MSNSTTDYPDDIVLVKDDIVHIAGAITSTVCVIALLTMWYIIPGWRSLQNYISMNQIIAETMLLWTHEILLRIDKITLFGEDLQLIANLEFFLTSICWSFCGTIVNYLKLVSIHRGKTSYEKRLVSAVVYALVLVAALFIFIGDDAHFIVVGVTVLILEMVNIVLFCVISVSVMSCCCTKMSKRNCSHVGSLIGMAIVSDLTLMFVMVTMMLSPTLERIGLFFYYLRIIPQTYVLLFNRSSRDQCRGLFRQCNNRRFII